MELNVGDIVQLSEKFMQCMQRGSPHTAMFPAFAASNGLAEVVAVDGQTVRITPSRQKQLAGAENDQVVLMLEVAALDFMGCHKLGEGSTAGPDALPKTGYLQNQTLCYQDDVDAVSPRPIYDAGLPHPFALGRVPTVVSQAYWIYGGAQSSKQQYAAQAGAMYEAGLRYRRDSEAEVQPVSIAMGECEQQLLVTSTNIIGEYMAMQFETFKASYAAARGAGNFFGAVAAAASQAEPRAKVNVVDEPVCLAPTPEPQAPVTFNVDW